MYYYQLAIDLLVTRKAFLSDKVQVVFRTTPLEQGTLTLRILADFRHGSHGGHGGLVQTTK